MFNLNWKDPMAILKAVGVFVALSIVASLVVGFAAMGVDAVSPGLGSRLKGHIPFKS